MQNTRTDSTLVWEDPCEQLSLSTATAEPVFWRLGSHNYWSPLAQSLCTTTRRYCKEKPTPSNWRALQVTVTRKAHVAKETQQTPEIKQFSLKRQKPGATQISSNSQRDKPVCSNNGILLAQPGESYIHHNAESYKHNVEQKKPDTKRCLVEYKSYLYQIFF